MAYPLEFYDENHGPAPGKTAQQLCADIAAFLSDNPSAWTQGVMARDPSGLAFDADDPRATSFCAMGLLQKFVTAPFTSRRCVDLLMRAVARPHQQISVPAYNDAHGRTVEEVIQWFRCASYMPDLTERVMEDQPKPEEIVLYGFGQPTQEAQAFWGTSAQAMQEVASVSASAFESLFKKLTAPLPPLPLFNFKFTQLASPPPSSVIKVPNWHEMLLKGSYGDLPKELLPQLGKETV